MDNIKQLRDHIKQSLNLSTSEIKKLTKLEEEINLYKLLTGEDASSNMELEELEKRNVIINSMIGLEGKDKAIELADEILRKNISLDMIQQLMYLTIEGHTNNILGNIDE